ncbi:MAG: GNAT family N-acetyltransferase [Candidatus Heimdallarchaeota archaeon]|nr:MAG: GNAT family N-acetyltransferase [Candidatus Heimdallarchaeota archaeon]
MSKGNLTISEMREADHQFLLDIWHIPQVMQYADEFPRLRGWSKSDDFHVAWSVYQRKRVKLGKNYTQLILWFDENTPIGESFFAPLNEGYKFGKWEKPDNVISLMGDIKLLPQYWGRGLGSKGIKLVIRFVFTKTSCELFVVPPHRLNPAASRVYDKVGFIPFTGMRSWRNHKIMEMTRKRYNEIYK